MDEFELRRALGRLSETERQPGHDLWPAIEARLTPRASKRIGLPRWPLALAAGLAALGLLVTLSGSWQSSKQAQQAPHALTMQAPPRSGTADALSLEYRAAFAELARAPLSPELQAVADTLDQDALRIRRALELAPESRLLIQQLRRTYAWRLRISRQYLNSQQLAATSVGREQARSV